MGVPVGAARVYRNGELLGTTDSGGNRGPDYWLEDDTLAVHYPIHAEVSPKHPGEPAWVVYATNITIPVNGDPELYVFGDLSAVSNPLVVNVTAPVRSSASTSFSQWSGTHPTTT